MEIREILTRWSQVRPRNAGQAESRMRWRIENAAERAAIYLYDEIGVWGVTAGDFVAELNSLGGKPVDLHVNSAGGDVFDGLAIYNALLQYPGAITAYVDALAASAASFIVQAAGERRIATNASMMIHEAAGLAIGNAEDLRQLATILDDSTMAIAEIYATRGGTVNEWLSAMKAETWYRGQAAIDAGLADGIQAPPARNAVPARPSAKAPEPVPTPAVDFEGLPIPPLATHSGYRQPVPDLVGLLAKHPLTLAGK